MKSRIPQAGSWWHDFDFGTGVSIALDARELHSEQTEYQHLQVFEHDSLGRVLVLDGIIQATQADEFTYHELIAHVALLGRARPPRRVLIIGGGDGGVLREVLRHEFVERAVMVEIDRAVVEASAKYLGIHGNYDEPRAELVIDDAAAWVRGAAGQDFDVAIIDSTDPGGPSEPLFGREFLADLRACLSADGVMVRQAGMPFTNRDELPAVARDARAAFGNVEVYAGDVPLYGQGQMAFVVASQDGASIGEPREAFAGKHYNAELHRAAFALPTWWRELIESD
jgi:spermidine synthase